METVFFHEINPWHCRGIQPKKKENSEEGVDVYIHVAVKQFLEVRRMLEGRAVTTKWRNFNQQTNQESSSEDRRQQRKEKSAN